MSSCQIVFTIAVAAVAGLSAPPSAARTRAAPFSVDHMARRQAAN